MRQLAVLAAMVGFAASGWCAPANSDCRWPGEMAGPRNLTADAVFAEDLAVRYADAHRGLHSGHFESWAAYGRARDTCMAGLFEIIATARGVTSEQVRESLTVRSPGWDLAVMLSFALLYIVAAYAIVRHLEKIEAAFVMKAYASLAVSLAGVLLGEIWALSAEGMRIGTGHMSYRVWRVPWLHHEPALFAAGLVLFWIVAMPRARVRASQA